MDYNLEQQLRNTALHLRNQGVITWDARLRAAGLSPWQWSDGAPTGLRPSADEARRDFGDRVLHRSAPLAAQSFDAESNSIECTWTTGAGVLRSNWEGAYNEVLEVTAAAVRLARLNAGAPFLNSHQSGALNMVLGAVVPGSARLVGGKGVCRITLSGDNENAGLIGNIKSGVIRNVSVGYIIHASSRTEAHGDGVATVCVTDWEPIEISAVAIPADASAQIRAA